MRKLVDYGCVSASYYDDGSVDVRWTRNDPATKKVISDNLVAVEVAAADPVTMEELLVMGLAARVSRRVRGIQQLVW